MTPWNEKASRALAYGECFLQRSNTLLHYLALHTGLPISVVAAVGLVLSYHLFRKGTALIFQFVIAFGLIVMATHFGWIHW